jgi:outer membrane protein assembly factor BamA
MKCTPFLCLAFLLAAPLPAAAQRFQPRNIVFKGATGYDSQDLLAAAGLKKGATLSSAEMKDHTQSLLDSGLFENITFTFNGVDLVFSVTPATTLYDVHIDNLPLVPGKALEDQLHQKLPLYHGKVPSEGTMLDDVRIALTELLAAEGIRNAVTAVPYSPAGQGKVTAMSFSISDSPVHVGAMHLEGVSPAMAERVRAVANRAAKSPFDTENTGQNLERALTFFYQDEGYAAVKVHATPSGDPAVTSAAIEVPYSISVVENRHYNLGSIHMPPDAIVTQADIDKAAGLDQNSTVKKVNVRDIWMLIASRYKSKGYLDCAVTPGPILDEATGTVSYEVDVKRGAQYHFAFVKFENADDELRIHLMRLWQMLPGDPFDGMYVSNFIAQAEKEDPRLLNSLQNVTVTYKVLADTQTHEVSCILSFARKHA